MTRSSAKFIFLYILSFSLLCQAAFAQRNKMVVKADDGKKRWVDSVYSKLNTEEKIGQLFMVPAYSGGPDFNQEKIETLLHNHQLGGIIFMQGGAGRQANLTNRYQGMANVPLLIAMDAEWGLGMRLDSVMNLPKSMMIGATRDTAIAYQMGATIAYQCRRLGVNVDFAPVVDVNNNPLNPVINMRSFGQDKTQVARMGVAFMRGMQNNGVIACAKHFPGHGDTDADSHKDLPVINKSVKQLDSLELYPFKELIKAGVKSMMVAHLEIPSLETEPHVPTTLSRSTVTGLLKTQLNYKGIVFTDAMNMSGVTKYFTGGEAELRALKAGSDMILMAPNVPEAIDKIKAALMAGDVKEEDIERSVKKVLAAKYDVGLSHFKEIDPENIVEDINKSTTVLRKKIVYSSTTLVRDDNKLIAKINARGSHVGYIGVNAKNTMLSEKIGESVMLNAEWVAKGSSVNTATRIAESVRNNDVNIVAVHNLNIYPANNFGLDANEVNFLRNMASRKNTLIVLMGNAYFMNNLCDAGSAIVAYDDDTLTQQVVADILVKNKKMKGALPVSVCLGQNGKPAAPQNELPVIPLVPAMLSKPATLKEAGVTKPEELTKLSAFVQKCMNEGAFPGCRILAAKDGKIIYNESFGYFDASKTKPVTEQTMYDVASMTKVLATNLAVMKLYDEGKISLDKTLGDYLPSLRNFDKGNLKIHDLLLHQAGLKSWIPFYKETIDSAGGLKAELYSKTFSPKFNTPVAKNLFLRSDYRDTIWSRINNSPLENKGKYVYSDLDFYYLAAVVEKITGVKIDRYADSVFYKPLGLKSTCYKPGEKMDITNITPTEDDEVFRRQLIQGYVHDQGAALLGGVAGHAGVFSTAADVAVIFQMLLNYGTYNGKRFFKTETVEKFIAYNSAISRRGLGFDKPSADNHDAGPTSDHCSGYTFGHQGFTGTCVWGDPVTGVVFVFLSNRVNPNAENALINKLNVRTVAQDYIYEALGYPANMNRVKVKQQQTGK